MRKPLLYSEAFAESRVFKFHRSDSAVNKLEQLAHEVRTAAEPFNWGVSRECTEEQLRAYVADLDNLAARIRATARELVKANVRKTKKVGREMCQADKILTLYDTEVPF